MICDYGCGQTAQHQLKNGKWCCKTRPSGCPTQKEINRQGLKQAYTEGRRPSGSVMYSSLPQDTKDQMAWSRGKSITPAESMFKENSYYSNELIKSRIIKDKLLEYKCVKCGLTDSWMGSSIVLDLDHINGDNTNNSLDNLRFLCPNCHSQTDTYKGRNKNTGTKKVTDEELLEAYEKCCNIRKALIAVGLAAKGGNYIRMQRLLKQQVK